MLVTEISAALPGGASLLRNEPVQARSSARLTGLLDAAAAVIDEIGFERLTTAMVAERAGASIGTVYRYFPDRIAVVEALALRCTQRLASRFLGVLDECGATTWQEASAALMDLTVSMYGTEPGFRSIRFGDMVSAGNADEDRMSALAVTVAAILHERFAVPDTDRITRAFSVLAETAHAVLARAYRDRKNPDERTIDEYRAMARGYLTSVIEAAS